MHANVAARTAPCVESTQSSAGWSAGVKDLAGTAGSSGTMAFWPPPCRRVAAAPATTCPPDPRAPRPFRAILNSALAPYKRLHLAAQVERLAVVGYVQDSDYHSAVLPPPGATWLNVIGSSSSSGDADCGSGSGSQSGGATRPAADGGQSDGPSGSSGASPECFTRAPGGPCSDLAGSVSVSGAEAPAPPAFLPPAQVCAALNRGEVGLALSELEGACWASTEYLLCGLPVVSTPCSGGREVW